MRLPDDHPLTDDEVRGHIEKLREYIRQAQELIRWNLKRGDHRLVEEIAGKVAKRREIIRAFEADEEGRSQ